MVAIPLCRRERNPRHTRDDVELEHRLVNFLNERHVPDSSSLRIESHGGTVVVHGRLHSKHDKWLCMECCRHVAGVIKLIDDVEIK
jgi:osmotically-inducible protein OsmY